MAMTFPIKTCVICSQEFELRPDKPGFANRCPECTAQESTESASRQHLTADEVRAHREVDEARRRAIRDLLYSKDS
jgi:hypothetical protein